MKNQEIIENLVNAMDWIYDVAFDKKEPHIQDMIHAISEAITIINEKK